jgi:hypothetical protein
MKAAKLLPGLDKLKRSPELHIEITASGNFVVKSVEFGEKIKGMNKYISTVEMEAAGIEKALFLEHANQADLLMIRGVSDYADKNKTALEKKSKDQWRAFAAANAARLLQTIFRSVPQPPVSPGYELDGTPDFIARFRKKGIPNIENKEGGAQNIAFPNLLSRRASTPELSIEVTTIPSLKGNASKCKGLIILNTKPIQWIEGTINLDAGLVFRLPESEKGYDAELLLSFRKAVKQISVTCEDDFNRTALLQVKK